VRREDAEKVGVEAISDAEKPAQGD
jgi:hypothetical protein